MPALDNPRHEKFAQGMAEGKTARKAYMDAGYLCKPSAADGSAAALRKNPSIQARILELSEAVADRVVERAAITKEWLEEKIQDLAKKAEDSGQLSVARSCYELLGRDRGAFIERTHMTVRSFTDMSAEEIEEFLAGSPTAGTEGPPVRRSQKGTGKAKG